MRLTSRDMCFFLVVIFAAGCSRTRSQASAATPPPPPAVEFIGEWGTAGADPGQLNDPVGPAVDDAGRVYLADRGTMSVDKFEANGVPLLSFEDPSLRGASDIEVDRGGGIYVSDFRTGTTKLFFPEGDFLRAFHITPQSNWTGPFSISVDEGGKVYVPDPNGGRIEVLDSRGKLVRSWKLPASAGAAPSHPSIALAAGGSVYIGDWQAGTIAKYSSDGFPAPGWQEPAAPEPRLLSLGASSKFLFALRDAAPHLQIWTLDGHLKFSDDLGGRLYSSSSGKKPSLGVSPLGEVVILDPAAPHILRFQIHLDVP